MESHDSEMMSFHPAAVGPLHGKYAGTGSNGARIRGSHSQLSKSMLHALQYLHILCTDNRLGDPTLIFAFALLAAAQELPMSQAESKTCTTSPYEII